MNFISMSSVAIASGSLGRPSPTRRAGGTDFRHSS
jgi:hypothetical protein